MPVSITHTQTRSVEAGPLYRVLSAVTDPVGIQPETFVFRVSDDEFQYVATVPDMLNVLNTKAAAVAAGDDLYRLSSVQRDHVSLLEAQDFGTTLSQRLQALVRQYDVAVNDFTGVTVEALSSNEAP
jgi:hypothetical protein